MPGTATAALIQLHAQSEPSTSATAVEEARAATPGAPKARARPANSSTTKGGTIESHRQARFKRA
eukprot:1563638-Alexandrium_andersonii.AAC.1